MYFLHRFEKEHWKRVFLDDCISSLILHRPIFFECTVIKWTETVPVQLPGVWYVRYWDSSTIKSSVLICYDNTAGLITSLYFVPYPYSRAGAYSVVRLLPPGL